MALKELSTSPFDVQLIITSVKSVVTGFLAPVQRKREVVTHLTLQFFSVNSTKANNVGAESIFPRILTCALRSKGQVIVAPQALNDRLTVPDERRRLRCFPINRSRYRNVASRFTAFNCVATRTHDALEIAQARRLFARVSCARIKSSTDSSPSVSEMDALTASNTSVTHTSDA
jgi:hypothetical protein